MFGSGFLKIPLEGKYFPLCRVCGKMPMNWLKLSSVEREVLSAVSNGCFIYSDHALLRMKQRGIIKDDICHCAETARSITRQVSNGRYVIKGSDLLFCETTVVVEIIDDIFLITAW